MLGLDLAECGPHGATWRCGALASVTAVRDASGRPTTGPDHRGDEGPDARRAGTGGWVACFAGGWLLSQMVGAVVFQLTVATFVVTGVASGVAASGVLQGGRLALAAGAPLAALAIWQIPTWATQIGAVVVGTRATGRSARADLGLRFRAVDLPIGAAAGVGVQVLVGAVYALLDIDAEGPARQLTSRGSGPAGLAGMLVLLALAAPVVEELLFRGLLQRGLEARLPRAAALVLTAAIFAAVHFQPVQFAGLLVAGLAFGALAMRFDRLGPAIVAHVCFNASTVLYLTLR